jgi:hypothetical protein
MFEVCCGERQRRERFENRRWRRRPISGNSNPAGAQVKAKLPTEPVCADLIQQFRIEPSPGLRITVRNPSDADGAVGLFLRQPERLTE